MRLPDFRACRIVIVGDVMLDRYWFGDVSRISPEAPVPVVRIGRQEERPGGAGNVARNIATLGARASLLSVVGDDEPGRKLKALAGDCGIDAALHVDSRIATTVKLRVIGRQQQLLRIDFETPPSNEALSSKLRDFSRRVDGCDLVLLSDYDKGGLRQVRQLIQLARKAGKPVLVDPKGADFSKYSGSTLITPNRTELRQVVGSWTSEKELARKVFQLQKSIGVGAILLTRSEEGMTLFSEGRVVHQPARARDVFDVTGAGDTVIAAMAAMHAAGAHWRAAMKVASAAAGIVVGRVGTAAVTRNEVMAELDRKGATRTRTDVNGAYTC